MSVSTVSGQPNFLRGGGGGSSASYEDNDAKRGMIIVSIVLLFLFCMIVLRFGLNLLIDLCILRDGESLVRTASEIRRFFCPCWHPRTTSATGNIEATTTTRSSSNANINNGETVTMEMLLSGLSLKQKQQVIESIVPCTTATGQDMARWKKQSGFVPSQDQVQNEPQSKSDSNDTSVVNETGLHLDKNGGDGNYQSTNERVGEGRSESTTDSKQVITKRQKLHCNENENESESSDHCHVHENRGQCKHQHQQQQDQHQQQGLICPICIHEIQDGDKVCYSEFCHHVFHQDCLSAWFSTYSRICPYCRRELITQQMLDDAHRIRTRRQQSQATAGDDDDDEDDDSEDDSDDEEISPDDFLRYRP
mmetsp:Transcript_3066/g.6931  ORF Transcript_3066/g.6931 Transcript_3066/m.6931 type:complete len:364 (-) Transcript_3066:3992-5083(-)